ncbi:hemoglobin subunit pi [Pelobates cultripes]|uniref:Hemoglobin subunit pi n=1 Tax=Pelobates cultripes TaxID=61616 RepID=A0AAD1VX18_PELCU|nr:hemoglobin subunit pi [Pelobates cultripes]
MSTPPLALSDSEKGALATFWVKITPEVTALGAAAMYRLILIHDDAREHYSQFDLSENSPDLRDHGVKIINAFGNAIKNMDNLPDAICDQNGLPMNVLHVETQHFWLATIRTVIKNNAAAGSAILEIREVVAAGCYGNLRQRSCGSREQRTCCWMANECAYSRKWTVP